MKNNNLQDLLLKLSEKVLSNNVVVNYTAHVNNNRDKFPYRKFLKHTVKSVIITSIILGLSIDYCLFVKHYIVTTLFNWYFKKLKNISKYRSWHIVAILLI